MDAALKRRMPYHCIGWLTLVAQNFGKDHPEGDTSFGKENPFAICADVMTGLVMALEAVREKKYPKDELEELIDSALKGTACYTVSRPYGRA